MRDRPERHSDDRGEDARPVGLAPLLIVGTAMAVLVAGLVWSIGRGLQWW